MVSKKFTPRSSPPPAAGKKMAGSPKVQMLKPLPSQFSAGKRFVQKELSAKAPPQVQLLDSGRLKFRETLAAALSRDSDHHFGQRSAGNVSPLGSAGGNMQADGGRMQGNATAFKDVGNDDENVTKVAARRSEHGDILHSNLRPDRGDMQQQTEHVALANKAWLSWAPDIVNGASQSMSQPNPKRARMSDVPAGVNVSEICPESNRAITTDESTEERKARIRKAQSLACTIEKELFKLCGEVNKKYKEKRRSLLSNLKDKNNPVLMERVMSGDITPKCLCAMTFEELASKELSEWRMAKAEKLANMKTHKGEFQVEVDGTYVIEVGLGGGSLSYVPSKPTAVRTKSVDKTSVQKDVKESDNSAQNGVAERCTNNTPSNLEYPTNERSDLMQEPMIDDLQDMELDEFMQILHSEPRFEDQSAGALQDGPSIDKADKALKSESFPIAKDNPGALKFQFHSDLRSPQDNFESKLESAINKAVSVLDPIVELKRDVIVKSPPEKVGAEKPDTVNGPIPESAMQCKISPDGASTHDIIWEGTIQLSRTSFTNIVAIFKSGEKPSTNEWPCLLEIKGRVSLSDLKDFLEQLHKSRSRAIMVTELCWKEGLPESGRHALSETIDSYIAKGRVGRVKVAEGVDMYFCPSQGEAAQIFANHLPKEHSGSLTVTETSIIGLVVWRRPNVSPRVPNIKDVPESRATISSSVLPRISQPPSRSSNACRPHQDVVTGDVLPGFTPGAVKDDHLPECNFGSASNSAANVTASQTYMSHQHTSLSEDLLREMVRKYGDITVAALPWNQEGDEFATIVHEDGNLPEWNPSSQGNLQGPQIPQPRVPYHMTRESQSPLPQVYPQHQHFAMPAEQPPLTQGNLMQPAKSSYYGVLGRGPDGSRTNGAWNRG